MRDDAVALDLCLRRLAIGTVAPLEVVVVDNASSDATAAVARHHGARVLHEPEVGVPAAAATGYDAARGDVVGRLDADSVPARDWVERVTERFAADPDLVAVTGTGVFYGVGPVRAALHGRAYLAAYYATTHAAIGRTPLWGSSMALRRSCWEAVRDDVERHGFEVHDDVDLAMALAARFGADARMELDRRLVVGVDARSLAGGAAGRRRWERAWRTLGRGWAVSPPWERWAVRLGAPGAGAADPGRA